MDNSIKIISKYLTNNLGNTLLILQSGLNKLTNYQIVLGACFGFQISISKEKNK